MNQQNLQLAALLLVAFAALITINVCVLVWVVKYTRRQARQRQFEDGPDFVDFTENCDDDGLVELEPAREEHEYSSSIIPRPNFGTRDSVNLCVQRARKLKEESEKVWNDTEDFFEAKRLAELAMAELDKNAKRDHWFAPRILDWLAWLHTNQGMLGYPEAAEYWERAAQIATEWHEQCSDLLPHFEECLAWVERQYPRGSSCED